MKIGDVVTTKCPGPTMVVLSVSPTQVYTAWFTKSHKMEQGRFPAEVLCPAHTADVVPLTEVA